MIETTISIHKGYLQNIYIYSNIIISILKSSNVHIYNVGKIISGFQSTKVKYQKYYYIQKKWAKQTNYTTVLLNN